MWKTYNQVVSYNHARADSNLQIFDQVTEIFPDKIPDKIIVFSKICFDVVK